MKFANVMLVFLFSTTCYAGTPNDFRLHYANALKIDLSDEGKPYYYELTNFIRFNYKKKFQDCVNKNIDISVKSFSGVLNLDANGVIIDYYPEVGNSFSECLVSKFRGGVAIKPPNDSKYHLFFWSGVSFKK